MKRAIGGLILLFLVSSLALGQDHYPRLLSPVDLSQVRQSGPGVVPANSMKFDPLVDDIVHQVNLDSLVGNVRILSGEDTAVVGGSKVLIRERGSQIGGDLAAEYLKQRLASYNLQVFDQAYSTTGRNIYAKQTGYLYPEKEYIICAHYDAVDMYCADDNASGAAGVLEAARILSKYDPKYTVVYAFWDEEEVGLIGSECYASQASSSQEKIQGVIDMDMIAWDGNGDYLADIHTRNTASSNDLANVMVTVDYLYDLPVKPVIYNPGTWQSDHSAFWNHGYGAILLIEAYYGGDLNPYYHGSDDRIDKFNLPYFHSMSKLSIGAMSTLVEVTTGTLLASVTPDYGYQTYLTKVQIRGANTHFQESSSTLTVWLSRGSETITADSVTVLSNRSLDAYFSLTTQAALGSWDVNVQSATDGLLTIADGLNILPPPALIAVSPETLSVSVEVGRVATTSLNIRNNGGSDLTYIIHSRMRQDGLVAFYLFEGNANDESGNNHHGTVHSATLTADRFGNPGSAYSFDGVDDNIDLGTWFTYRIFTVAMWINPGNSQPEWAQIIDNNHSTDANWDVQQYGNSVNRYWFGWVGPGKFFDLVAGQWQHLVVLADPERNRMIYVNGNPVGQPEYGGDFNYANPPHLMLGEWCNGGGRNWFGSLDDIYIYDRALTDAEVSMLMFLPFRLAAEPDSGVIVAGSSTQIALSIDATELEVGQYDAVVIINCNDPFTSIAVIPIHVIVTPATGIKQDVTSIKQFALIQNYPNPFNPSTSVTYELPKASHVRLMVYDALGQEVATLVNESKPAGVHMVQFDAGSLASGVYFYQLHAGGYVATKRMLVLR